VDFSTGCRIFQRCSVFAEDFETARFSLYPIFTHDGFDGLAEFEYGLEKYIDYGFSARTQQGFFGADTKNKKSGSRMKAI
jgi:hypothetical protein